MPTVGGDEDAWGGYLNTNWTSLDTLLGGVTNTEFEILVDGTRVNNPEKHVFNAADYNDDQDITVISREK